MSGRSARICVLCGMLLSMVIAFVANRVCSTPAETRADAILHLQEDGKVTVELSGDLSPEQANAIAKAQEVALEYQTSRDLRMNSTHLLILLVAALITVLFLFFIVPSELDSHQFTSSSVFVKPRIIGAILFVSD